MNSTAISNLMQVSFRASGIGTNIQDDGLTSEVASNHNIRTEQVRVTKNLLKDAVAPINKRLGKVRRWLNERTFPGIANTRLCVAAEREEIERVVGEAISDLINEVDTLVNNWDHWMQVERDEKKSAFRSTDYPSRDTVRQLFSFTLEIYPMPDPNQFALVKHLTEHERERLSAQAEARIAAAVQDVQRRVMETLVKMIADVAETLEDEDAPIIDSDGKKGALPKLHEYMERVPQLNFTNDPGIDRLYREAREKLNVSSDVLRKVKYVRRNTAEAARGILAGFGQLGKRSFA